MSIGSAHVSVLVEECMEWLAVREEGIYVDCTAGGGGHAAAIAQRLASGRLLALDRDPAAVELTRLRLQDFGGRVRVRQAAFRDLGEAMREEGMDKVNGILADLGLSQMQLDDARRGFSFAAEGDLDMRMDPQQTVTAAQAVNHLSERELADVLYQYAEERRSRRIAKAIVRARPLRTARQLADVVASAARGSHFERIHPATRTFQALRIYVNNEIGELEALLRQAPERLAPAGRLVIISFHSLEDRVVKNTFRRWSAEGTCRVLTRHVVRPSEQEIAGNPKARSARLRCAERI
jgi:16S rRNA (cytosine1402-N4)-methyltransferase